jgi:hypothetical protein
MEKTIIQIKGNVAEVMEKNGLRQAKIVCSGNPVMISILNLPQIEFGSEVSIEGILEITSIEVKDTGLKKIDTT